MGGWKESRRLLEYVKDFLTQIFDRIIMFSWIY